MCGLVIAFLWFISKPKVFSLCISDTTGGDNCIYVFSRQPLGWFFLFGWSKFVYFHKEQKSELQVRIFQMMGTASSRLSSPYYIHVNKSPWTTWILLLCCNSYWHGMYTILPFRYNDKSSLFLDYRKQLNQKYTYFIMVAVLQRSTLVDQSCERPWNLIIKYQALG